MNSSGWIQLLLFVAALWAITKPLGLYLCSVLDRDGKTPFDPLLKPLERLTYKLIGVQPSQEQSWKGYTRSLLLFSFIALLFSGALLMLQGGLPLNPQQFPSLNSSLAFNTATSFVSNTNWQSYAGESTMSYFSQMVPLTLQNFLSAAVGISVAAVLVRGITRHSTQTLGNFWIDLTRSIYYLLLPLSVAFALVLVSQGVIQNYRSYVVSSRVEPSHLLSMESHPEMTQTIIQGPIASQVAIKIIGTNGGGYTNANAAHPFENPTPLSNFLQMLGIFAIPSALTYFFGRAAQNQRHGWAIWTAMLLLFLVGALVTWHSEAAGNPHLTALGIDPAGGNMEGKEVRFGSFNSALFAAVTTAASCGAVNAMHDSFTPLGGFIPLLNMQLGEVVFGGVGAGLYGMLIYVMIAVFIAGLMIGRTPEYLGKKIESFEIKMASLVILTFAFTTLGFTAWSCLKEVASLVKSTTNSGPHGFTEILYAYTSATANNGSAFAGFTANSSWIQITLGFAMLLGRYAIIIPILALAGSLGRKRRAAGDGASFPVSGPLFIALLIATILLIGALTFVPALALGPIVEHFLMHAGKLF